MIPHLYFRRDLRFQKHLRCLTPGCGFVARRPGDHITHALGRTRTEETL